MEDDSIRKHLRAALNEIISSEKNRLHQLYHDSDADIAQRVKKMAPIIQALNVLQNEIGEIKGLEISTAPYGHMATISLETSVSSDYFSISTNIGNTNYTVERLSCFFIGDDEPVEKEYNYDDASEVLKLVVDAIGKHIASEQVLHERKK
jgi:hypothetical protein